MTEHEPNFEFNSEEQLLIALLREKGPQDQEARQHLLQWTETGEREAHASPSPRAAIEFNLRRARLYYVAGLKEEAWENLEAARQQAHQERQEDLLAKTEGFMDQIDQGTW